MSELGNPVDGLTEILEGIEAYHATDAHVSTPWYLGMAASAQYRLGNIKMGLEYTAEALRLAEDTKDKNFEVELWRLQGELLRCCDNSEREAEDSFHQAIDVAQRQHAKLWELRATVSLCRLWQNQGKCAEAHQMLSEIYGWFTEGFDTVDLVEAKALLAELAKRVE
ncbi:MAG: hypothetical protein AAF702_43665 [Chloroflexota bacterium]